MDEPSESERRRFEELVARHQGDVCAMAYAVLRDRARSEEVAQDAFLVAWQRARTAPITVGWICAVARNLARNAARRRTEVTMSGRVIDEAAAVAPDARDALITHEAARDAATALAGLPERYRDAVVLYYRGDESMAAVAAALGVSAATAKQRVHRGRERLREALGAVQASLRATRPGPAFTAAVVGAWLTRGPSAEAATAAREAAAGEGGGGAAWPWLPVVVGGALGLAAIGAVVAVDPAPRASAAIHAASVAPEWTAGELPLRVASRFAPMRGVRPIVRPRMVALETGASAATATATATAGAALPTVNFDFIQAPVADLLRVVGDVLEAPILMADGFDDRLDIRVEDVPAIDVLDQILGDIGAQREEVPAIRLVDTGGRADAASLGGPLVSIDVVGAPANDIIELLEHELAMPITRPWTPGPVDQPPQPLVTLHVTDVTAGAALEQVLPQLGRRFVLTTGFTITRIAAP